jgi:hypothetical protein
MNKSLFEINNFISEFEWVLDVLKSCQTIEQVNTASYLYNNFVNKWYSFKDEFYEIFEKNRLEFELEKLKLYTKLP